MKFFTKLLCFTITLLLVVLLHTKAQVSFNNSNSQLQGTTHSGCPITVVDVNGDGLDDIVRLDQAHNVYIDYQRPGLQFSHNHIADFGGGSGWAWGMCVADVDHNGFKDVLAGGYGPSVKLLMIDNTGLSGAIIDLPSSDFFLQNTNFMDVNNDGWEDIFGCDDNDESHIWVNDGAGNFTVSSIIDFDVTNTDDSGNYGSVWTDFDNDNDVDFYLAKCRQGVYDTGDGRRIDVLFVNDGNNHYTSDAAAYGLADSGETWTCNFADIDNDGDLDAIQVDQDVPAKLLQNDGTGHMTNITTGSGFDVSDIYPLESVMEDFDNDGYVDILVTGGYGQADFFHNNGDYTFTKLTGLFDANEIESFAIGDLNHDGRIDIYAGYAQVYTTPSNIADAYWMNSTNNGNHFITFNLIGTTSSAGAYGARVTLYGSWGKQVREVHAGESYGTCNTTNLHFGLGATASIDSAVVRFQSGTVITIVSPSIDQFITVKEGGCISPDFTISANGPFAFCAGQSLTLTASALPGGYSYLWSDGSTQQDLVVSASGSYYVTAVSANDACSVTAPAAIVIENPAEIPSITVSGDLTFCEGGSVVLTSTPAAGYTWSNGETSQSITVTQTGTYSVTTQGLCQDWVSTAVNVTMLASPAPVTQDVTIGAPASVTLTATGTNVSWYDVPIGGSPVATGNSFITPVINVTTTYYAEDYQSYNAGTYHTGQFSHHGSPYSSDIYNYGLDFDVFAPCTLTSVKVYTDEPGNRLIELRDNNGNVLQSLMVNIPMDSSVITLNFDLTPGSNYELGTNTAQNNILLGYDSPHLERSDAGINYPYTINNVVSITHSPAADRYYYFYDWVVNLTPIICISARSPATVHLVTGIEDVATNNFELFPNPSEGIVTITADKSTNEKVTMQIIDAAGKSLLTKTEEGMKQDEEIHLDLTQFSKGIYFLNIQSGENSVQHKIVIQ